MTTEQKLELAIKELEFIKNYCAPDMVGFENNTDRMMFIRIIAVLPLLKP